jgi:hypothetical protein
MQRVSGNTNNQENTANDHQTTRCGNFCEGFVYFLRVLLPFLFGAAEVVEDVIIDVAIPNPEVRNAMQERLHEGNLIVEAAIESAIDLRVDDINNHQRIPDENHPNIEATSRELKAAVNTVIHFGRVVADTIVSAELHRAHFQYNSPISLSTNSAVGEMADLVERVADRLIDDATIVLERVEERAEEITDEFEDFFNFNDNTQEIERATNTPPINNPNNAPDDNYNMEENNSGFTSFFEALEGGFDPSLFDDEDDTQETNNELAVRDINARNNASDGNYNMEENNIGIHGIFAGLFENFLPHNTHS